MESYNEEDVLAFLFAGEVVAGSYSTRNIHGPATATELMPVIPAPVRHLHTELNRVDHMFIAEDRTYFYLSGHTGISELCKGIDY